jgi:glycosyltransferase involved in cell wall biosynthesis
MNPKVDISIITPCFNEEDNVLDCARSVAKVMAAELPGVSYEHIFVDNSSTDGTFHELRKIANQDLRVKVIVNSRNIGPFRSMYRGMKRAVGDSVIPMLPADLQDPVEIIPKFYQLWISGSLVVFGVRENRQESLFMRFLRSIYYRVIRTMSDTDIPLNAGEFMLIDKRIANEILKLDDHYPYIRGLVAQSTSRSAFVPYTWVRRRKGKSKANWFQLFDQAINGLISTSRAPARLALIFGFLVSSLAIIGGIFNLIVLLFEAQNISNGIPTLIIVLFFFGGIQLFFTGLLGEYILSTHSQTRKLPDAFDVNVINFD